MEGSVDWAKLGLRLNKLNTPLDMIEEVLFFIADATWLHLQGSEVGQLEYLNRH